MTKTVKALLKELKAQKTIADADLTRIAWQARPSWMSAIHDAKEALVGLEAEYREYLKGAIAGIVLSGTVDEQAEFEAQPKPTTTFTASAWNVYQSMANAVDESLGTDRLFTPTSFGRLTYELRLILDQIPEFERRQPDLNYASDEVLHTLQDVHAFVAKIVESSDLGTDLLVSVFERKVLDAAIAADYTETVAPVVIYGLSDAQRDAVAQRLFKDRYISVNLGSDTSEEAVQKAYQALKKKLKPQASANTSKNANN